ncbi:MAG: hypothetical protein ACLU93_00170 [Streptococcus sp.]
MISRNVDLSEGSSVSHSILFPRVKVAKARQLNTLLWIKVLKSLKVLLFAVQKTTQLSSEKVAL